MVSLIFGVFIVVSLNHLLKEIIDHDFVRMHLLIAKDRVVSFTMLLMASFFLMQVLPLVIMIFFVSGASGMGLFLIYLGLLHLIMYGQGLYYVILPECSSIWVSVLAFPLLLPLVMMFAFVISHPSEGMMLMLGELLAALNLLVFTLGPFVVLWGIGLKRGY